MVVRPGVSAVIFEEGRVLLQRRDDNRMWGLPGGGVEPGESVRQAVIREVHEETGLTVEPLRLIGVYSDPANHQIVSYPNGEVVHYVSTTFECRVLGGVLTTCAESLELAYFDPDALPPDVLPLALIRLRDALARHPVAFVR
jgi:ADP-ribose pyrophosphatase YjhB (NUDIX family)